MPGDRAVVVGFDGSEQARQATRWAAHEASSRGCGLVIVHALRGPVPELVYTPMSMPLPEAVSDQAVRSRTESRLADLAAECERQWSDVDVRTCLEHGNPAEVLRHAGRDADLIVVGSSGHSGLARALLGSVPADLARSCERPVVVVRDDATRDGRVVVGVDGSETGAKAIDFAFEYAARHQRDLLAVHAWADLPVDALAPLREWDYNWNQVRGESDALIARCLAGHHERHPDVHVERVVSFDGPAHALLDAAKDAALLVVGSHGRGLLRRALLGSVSHAVLYQAPCSVAVVHHDNSQQR
jgi:nucleotide-binding universal stress UspA family protein